MALSILIILTVLMPADMNAAGYIFLTQLGQLKLPIYRPNMVQLTICCTVTLPVHVHI